MHDYPNFYIDGTWVEPDQPRVFDGVALIERLHLLWSTGNRALLSHIYHPDFVAYWPPSSAIPLRKGREAVERGLVAVRSGFPDWCERLEDVFASGERVADRFCTTGTHLGSFANIKATSNCVSFVELGLYRLANGLSVEQWCLFDEIARLRQLGLDDANALRFVRGA